MLSESLCGRSSPSCSFTVSHAVSLPKWFFYPYLFAKLSHQYRLGLCKTTKSCISSAKVNTGNLLIPIQPHCWQNLSFILVYADPFLIFSPTSPPSLALNLLSLPLLPESFLYHPSRFSEITNITCRHLWHLLLTIYPSPAVPTVLHTHGYAHHTAAESFRAPKQCQIKLSFLQNILTNFKRGYYLSKERFFFKPQITNRFFYYF